VENRLPVGSITDYSHEQTMFDTFAADWTSDDVSALAGKPFCSVIANRASLRIAAFAMGPLD